MNSKGLNANFLDRFINTKGGELSPAKKEENPLFQTRGCLSEPPESEQKVTASKQYTKLTSSQEPAFKLFNGYLPNKFVIVKNLQIEKIHKKDKPETLQLKKINQKKSISHVINIPQAQQNVINKNLLYENRCKKVYSFTSYSSVKYY